jgi:hypothetical protein
VPYKGLLAFANWDACIRFSNGDASTTMCAALLRGATVTNPFADANVGFAWPLVLPRRLVCEPQCSLFPGLSQPPVAAGKCCSLRVFTLFCGTPGGSRLQSIQCIAILQVCSPRFAGRVRAVHSALPLAVGVVAQ